MDKEIHLTDPQIGDVLFKYNRNAKRYIIRIKFDVVMVTIPYGGNYKSAEAFFHKNKTVILQKINKFKSGNRPVVPDEQLRLEARLYLPKQLERLAKEHGFKYNAVRIQKSKTRWGSCSSKATINLSLYLMLLPAHLIEYVLLHELCHTVQMDHSPAFWALLDKHTNGKARELRSELKKQILPV
ncbi:MAG: M48 family metallopeptidase [Dysgonamonadaceae bacterium]|jgi:predicted metal-dependent hydrolase|nr:M48 family metallopeptidase [Dysgonamonadaceae bacterium]